MKVRVLKRKSKEMKAFDKAEWKYHDQEHFGKEIIWDTKMYFLKAYKGRSILGTLELKVEAGIGAVKILLVSHAHMRQGVGKVLMQKAEEISRAHNCHKMFLNTGKNWEAVKFYEAMGFTKTGELKKHYFKVDFVEFTKFL